MAEDVTAVEGGRDGGACVEVGGVWVGRGSPTDEVLVAVVGVGVVGDWLGAPKGEGSMLSPK